MQRTREQEERNRADEIQDGREEEAHPPCPHPRGVLLCQVGALPRLHIHGEKLPAHLVAEGGSDDGHGVEEPEVDGDVLGMDDVVDKGGAQSKEGRGSHPDQEETEYEHEVGDGVALGAGLGEVLAPTELGPGVDRLSCLVRSQDEGRECEHEASRGLHDDPRPQPPRLVALAAKVGDEHDAHDHGHLEYAEEDAGSRAGQLVALLEGGDHHSNESFCLWWKRRGLMERGSNGCGMCTPSHVYRLLQRANACRCAQTRVYRAHTHAEKMDTPLL